MNINKRTQNHDQSNLLLSLSLLVAAALICFFFNIGHFPLFDIDEGAFSSATREMLLHNDFITISLNGEPRYDKPIFIYWAQALSASIFGNQEFAYRLPSAIASLLWAYSIFWFTRKQFGNSIAINASLLMMTTLLISVIGKAATADALLNLFITTSLLNLFLYFQDADKKHLYWAVFFTALGTLTKGPIAIALPVIVGALYALPSREQRRLCLSIVYNIKAWLIFLLIVLPWPIMLYQTEGADFFREFLFVHNLGRFSGSMEGHSGNYSYYLFVLLIGFLPHTFILISALFNIRGLWQQPVARFILIWFLFIFLFFTFSSTKLPHYLIYGLSGLFVLMALRLEQIKPSIWLYLPQFLLAALLLAFPLLIQNSQQWIPEKKLSPLLDALPEAFGTGYTLFLVGFLLITVYLSLEKRLPFANKLIASGLAMSFFVSAFFMPGIALIQQQPIKEAGLVARDIQQPLVTWRVNFPSFNIYAERPSELRDPVPGDLVLTSSKQLQNLPAYQLLYEKRGIVLVSVQSSADRALTGDMHDSN